MQTSDFNMKSSYLDKGYYLPTVQNGELPD